MLEALFLPARVAVLADSLTAESPAMRLLERLVGGGFEGDLVAVCPVMERGETAAGSREGRGVTVRAGGVERDVEMLGRAKDAPRPLDLALIHMDASLVKGAVRDAARSGARAVVVVSGGFRGSGPEGERLERELVELCEERGLGLLGPGSMGVLNVGHRMNASLAPALPRRGCISIISQNGAVSVALLDWAARRRLGVAKLVCLGDKAGFGEVDLLRALAWDPETAVIVAYLESISSGGTFMKVAEEVSDQKPVIVLKAGITPAGARAAAAATGQLTDTGIAYGAAFRRAGVARAPTVESLLDLASAFTRAPLPGGDRVGIVTTGGAGVLAADAVEMAGLRVSAGPGVTPAPVDIPGAASPEELLAALDRLEAEEVVDAVILALAPQAMEHPLEVLRAISSRPQGGKPVLASWLGGHDLLSMLTDDERSRLPDFPSPERAVAALAAMHDYAAWRRRPPRVVARFPVNRRRVERILTHHLRSGDHQLSEVRSKEVLRAYGFLVPEGELATSGARAVEIAERIGLPVALKIDSPDIPHKTAAGAIRLNLGNPEAVHDAFDLMMLRISERMPHARVNGVFVERMGFSGQEVVLGMQRDALFGPKLLFGLGGAVVETMQDVSFHLAPITADEAQRMLEATRSFQVLDGSPGGLVVDIRAVAEGLQRISQLATDFPQIREMDISPFVVGDGAVDPYVADARILIGPGGDHV